MLKLSDLKINQKAKIVKIQSHFLNKLLSIGFIPDEKVTLIHIAPGGDPIEFEIKGSFISLRKSVCQGVEVDLIE